MSGSPLVFWFTTGLLIVVPIAMFIIGFRGTRKDDPNEQRAGYAMLKLAGLVSAIVAAATVYILFIAPSGNEATVSLITAALL